MTTTPAQIELTIYQGATFVETFEWKTLSEGANEAVVVNLTGCKARMQVRESKDAANWILELTTENDGLTITPQLGLITMQLSAVATGALGFKSGAYDLEVETLDGYVTRLLEGKVTVSSQVTR